MKCKYCNGTCIKKGKTQNRQRYKCCDCSKYQQETYCYNSYSVTDFQIIKLLKEGVGIRGISRLLQISNSTVINRILRIAHKLKRKSPILSGQTYQVDELFTYVGNKNNRVCIAYSLNSQTGEIIDLIVGKRNKTTWQE